MKFEAVKFMILRNFAYKIGLFAATFFLGILFANLAATDFRKEEVLLKPAKKEELSFCRLPYKPFWKSRKDEGSGCSNCSHLFPKENRTTGKFQKIPVGSRRKELQVIEKPTPYYTITARENMIQGAVRLRVTFLASGEIGNIGVIQGLGYGLNESAVEAARQIKFKPVKIDGKPFTVQKEVKYTFNLL